MHSFYRAADFRDLGASGKGNAGVVYGPCALRDLSPLCLLEL